MKLRKNRILYRNGAKLEPDSPSGYWKQEFLTKIAHLVKSSEALEIHPEADVLNDLIIDSIRDIKGNAIVKIDLRKLDDAPTDFFILCEGDSNTQIRSIAENINKRLKQEAGLFPSHLEGLQHAKWICIDYFSTVVHIFYPETRSFYALEELWSDAVFTEYETI